MKPDYIEELSEALAALPEEKREFVAACMLNLVNGMNLEADLQKQRESA